MSEYLHVEKTLLDQFEALDWTVIDQAQGMLPPHPSKSLRTSFREWILPEVSRDAIRPINPATDAQPRLTDRELDGLRDQLLRQPGRTPLEVNEVCQGLFPKTQVDRNELPGDTPGCVKRIIFTARSPGCWAEIELRAHSRSPRNSY